LVVLLGLLKTPIKEELLLMIKALVWLSGQFPNR